MVEALLQRLSMNKMIFGWYFWNDCDDYDNADDDDFNDNDNDDGDDENQEEDEEGSGDVFEGSAEDEPEEFGSASYPLEW